MSLFEKVFKNQEQDSGETSPAEAFAAITLAAIASDGYLSDEEAQGMSSTLSRMKLFRSFSDEAMRRMFDKLLGILKKDGINSLFDFAQGGLPADLGETAFAVATDMVLSDGVVTDEEQEFLKKLQEALSISDDTSEKIVEVMLIKNRG